MSSHNKFIIGVKQVLLLFTVCVSYIVYSTEYYVSPTLFTVLSTMCLLHNLQYLVQWVPYTFYSTQQCVSYVIYNTQYNVCPTLFAVLSAMCPLHCLQNSSLCVPYIIYSTQYYVSPTLFLIVGGALTGPRDSSLLPTL